MKIILIILLFCVLTFAQTATNCHGCFETKWRTQTATVTCDETAAAVQSLHAAGFTQTQISARFETTGEKQAVCDILGIKILP